MSLLALAFVLALAACATPAQNLQGSNGGTGVAATGLTDRERDRQSILAMAGDYRVKFDMHETTAIFAGYKPIEQKFSGAYEAVRVVEDSGDTIRLQHLLVVDSGGKTMVIKHWRQDWTWQPATVLNYRGNGAWENAPVPAASRAGAWSQTVWQTDDSPRYGGIGRWLHDRGEDRWVSNETLRPLARRDATKYPVYDRYLGVNKHVLTPRGWVHEQDNAKLGVKPGSTDGSLVTYVHEWVLNTYDRSSDFNVAAAESYWSATSGYWAEVRKMWDRALAAGTLRVEEEADTGSVTGTPLMNLADQLIAKKIDQAQAVAEARKLIESNTGKR